MEIVVVSQAPNIACIGEAMIELVLDRNILKLTRGWDRDGLNTAIDLRRHLKAEHRDSYVAVLEWHS